RKPHPKEFVGLM
nr:tachykinin [Petromyzon marinus]